MSVRHPRASANGATVVRRRSYRVTASWRRRASRMRSLLQRPVCSASLRSSSSSFSSSRTVTVLMHRRVLQAFLASNGCALDHCQGLLLRMPLGASREYGRHSPPTLYWSPVGSEKHVEDACSSGGIATRRARGAAGGGAAFTLAPSRADRAHQRQSLQDLWWWRQYAGVRAERWRRSRRYEARRQWPGHPRSGQGNYR